MSSSVLSPESGESDDETPACAALILYHLQLNGEHPCQSKVVISLWRYVLKKSPKLAAISTSKQPQGDSKEKPVTINDNGKISSLDLNFEWNTF
jgi:hypothetical protein